MAQSINFWSYSVLVLATGWMIDRVGSRKTIFVGGVFCLTGWLALSSVNSLWQLYIYYGLIMAIATGFTHWVPLQATSRKWFTRYAGLAGGIIGSAYSAGNAIFVPLLTLSSSINGWRGVSIASGFIFSLPIVLLAYFVIRDTPESIGQVPDGIDKSPETFNHRDYERKSDLGTALRSPQLWLLFFVYGLIGLVINALHSHLIVWAVTLGSSISTSGVFVTLFNGPAIIARLLGGWLSDRYGRAMIIVTGIFLSLIVMLISWVGINTNEHLLFYTPLIGLGTSFSTGLFAPYLGDIFGRKNVGSLFGILTFGWGLIGGFGPILWGIIYDNTGGYKSALLFSVCCFSIALILFIIIKNTSAPREID